jgi:hypothetical protein
VTLDGSFDPGTQTWTPPAKAKVPPHNLQALPHEATASPPPVIAALTKEILGIKGALVGGSGPVQLLMVQGAFNKVASRTTAGREVGILAALVADISTQIQVKNLSASTDQSRGLEHRIDGEGAVDGDLFDVVMGCIKDKYPEDRTN